MGLKAVLSCLFLANVCLAQQSSSYKLSEQTFNAGGHPANGVVLASTSFTVRLDAIGGSFAGIGGSGSYRADGGFTAAYPPPGEVLALSFLDATTLKWRPERSAGVYSLYRGLLTGLSGLGYGDCQQHDLTTETAIEPGTPPTQDGWFYLVTVRNRLREEGTKGTNSAGAERLNPHPCP